LGVRLRVEKPIDLGCLIALWLRQNLHHQQSVTETVKTEKLGATSLGFHAAAAGRETCDTEANALLISYKVE